MAGTGRCFAVSLQFLVFVALWQAPAAALLLELVLDLLLQHCGRQWPLLCFFFGEGTETRMQLALDIAYKTNDV